MEEFQECTEHLEDSPIDEQQPQGQPQDPVDSLHAIKGSQGPHTKRFEDAVGTAKAIVLVDSGSTHNFLDIKLASQLQLPICQQ